ncbi:hypothetical protein GVN16_04050 [Emticicia sp. CRIBPO]|uniref:lipopolysaccharide biosynthesis protein n=1 Tax=Emticicia sp. CRIBPO TaxID=2683258 RepID=UPI001411B8FB|nr:hypothetical protein [Emticicia sp. CRIBPO]NBA84915.1 hypothetical protein [Emticicia sp. CRIBPO]
MIRQRVYQYGFSLVMIRGISFLFSLLIIRSLALSDIGNYSYLIGIASFLEVLTTLGSPVSIQTQSGKSKNSNLAVSASVLGIGFCLVMLAIFFTIPLRWIPDPLRQNTAAFFVLTTVLSNTVIAVAVAYYRSMLNVKNDHYILLGRELLKFIIILLIKIIFSLDLNNILFIMSAVNILTVMFVLSDLVTRSDKTYFQLKENILFLIKNGVQLMLTFFTYAFPLIFVRLFSYTHFGKEAAGLLNICMVTNAGFQLYAVSWGMAIKPVIGKLNNEQNFPAISKLWKDYGNVYLAGCLVLYITCLVFYGPVLSLFKLDPNNTTTKHLYFIVLLFNLVYSIGSINNSFLQMLKLTRFELKGLAWGLLLYPLVVWYCRDKDILTLAWAIVLLELFKLIVQEFVFYTNNRLKPPYRLLFPALIIIAASFFTWKFSMLF